MGEAVSLEAVFELARQLPLRDKLRLIAWIAHEIERELPPDRANPGSRFDNVRS